MVRAIVHIGGEKTGTTSIQEFCSRNRAILAESGILYPKSPGAVNHLRLTAYALNDDRQDDDVRLFLGLKTREDIEPFRAEFEDALIAEIKEFSSRKKDESRNTNTIIFSNEHLQSRLVTVEEIERLRSLLMKFTDDIRIVVYIRRQDQVAVSYYSTRLKASIDSAEDVFEHWGTDESIPDYYDYDTMLKRYESVFGLKNITVRIFDRERFMGGDLIRDFRAVCRIPNSPEYAAIAKENLSLSPVGIQFYRRFNQQVPRFIDGVTNPLRAGINPTMMERFSGKGPKIARADAEAFFARFGASNAAISSRYFPGESEKLFNEDFSSYDGFHSNLVTGNDLVDLAIHLWVDRSQAVEELKLENSLLRFSHSFRRNAPEPLPVVPISLFDGKLQKNLLMRYLGALLLSQDFARAIDVAEQLLDTPVSPPVVVLARGFALYAMGASGEFEHPARNAPLPAKVAQSLASLETGSLNLRKPKRWLEVFKNGDTIQSTFYNRCWKWLE